MNSPKIYFLFLLMFLSGSGCKKEEQASTQSADQGLPGDRALDIDTKGIPGFVNTDYIELDKIAMISKFRSAVGHDYSDSFESCRSMKHYFFADSLADWSNIKISSPVDGTIFKAFDEWAGTQIQIQSKEFPAVFISIFHIKLSAPLKVGDVIHAGQMLGTHIGSQTMSDIAIGINTTKGWKLVSYFDVMTDSLFSKYQLRGLKIRSDAIITKELRDAYPLNCSGESFSGNSTLENWTTLK